MSRAEERRQAREVWKQYAKGRKIKRGKSVKLSEAVEGIRRYEGKQ